MKNDIDFIKEPSLLNTDDRPLRVGNFLDENDEWTEEEILETLRKMPNKPKYYVADIQEKQVNFIKERDDSLLESKLTKNDKLRVIAGVIATSIILLGIVRVTNIRDKNIQEGEKDYKNFILWATTNDLEINEDNYIYFINNEINENISGQSRGAK